MKIYYNYSSSPPVNICSNDLGRGESNCSGSEFPPGFENFFGAFGPSNRDQIQNGPMQNSGHRNSLEEKNEIGQSFGESLCSFSNTVEKVSQTPMLESLSGIQSDDNEVQVPCEEDLVGARISWDIGKTLGLKVSNENAMFDALAKVQECQDFVMPRKRGRPRKNKDSTKI